VITEGSDGAHGQLGLTGGTELADHQHSQSDTEGLGDRRRDRYATTGERQHHRIAPRISLLELPLGRQHAAGVGSVEETQTTRHDQLLMIMVDGDQPWWTAIAVR
jgi:hypothetical protein